MEANIQITEKSLTILCYFNLNTVLRK